MVDASRIAELGEFATRPHVLDRNMAPTLPVLWHVLHLPRSSFDFADLSASQLSLASEHDVSSNIVCLPFSLALSKTVDGQIKRRPADLVFFDEALDVELISRRFPDALAICPFGDARADALRGHWELLAARLPVSFREHCEPPHFVPRNVAGATLLPAHLFARQLYASDHVDDSDDHRLRSAWMQLVCAATLSAMENAGIPQDEARHNYDRWMKAVSPSVAANVVLGVPGVSPAYTQAIGATAFAYSTSRDPETPAASDSDIEADAINYMVAHRAGALYGIGAALPPIPEQCFRDLAELEDYFALPRPVRPRVVRRLLRRISDGLLPLFNDEDLLSVLKRCKTLTVFSNFPVGLAVMPGATSPLSCMFPISYRPLSPLSRTVLQEGLAPYVYRLNTPIKILLVECVDPADPIYALGREVWPALARQVSAGGAAEMVIVGASTPVDVREAIDRESPSILIISAHGFYDRPRNASGIIIGGARIMGPELGPMPPLVILSACHVSPRGVGTVSIVDMLLRAGATAVLGTQVPVNAIADQLLLGRFFTNLRAGLSGELALHTIQDVWQHVLATNAVYDVVRVSRRAYEWAFNASVGGRRLLVEFANHRSKGRLRSAHIYQDTEAVLQELADETGFGVALRGALRSEGYLPYSAFYYLAGWPERIIVSQAAEVGVASDAESTGT